MGRSFLSETSCYKDFRASVPLKAISVDAQHPDKHWKLFDCGPRDVSSAKGVPLVCLPPVSGTADSFFTQCVNLSRHGYRVIGVEWPPYWNLNDWCVGFRALLTHLALEKVHLFGAALGGFLAQKFAEFTRPCPRVASLILCNTFTDSEVFQSADQAPFFWLTPNSVLKKMVLVGIIIPGEEDGTITKACEFMAERLETLKQPTLASRLTLNCTPAYVKPHLVNELPVTIIDVWDSCALSQQVKEDVYKCYPHAKLAHLKTGGNFPFLSRTDEVNMHILIHLRNFDQGI